MSVRARLIAVFVAATVVPLGLTLWMTTSLLEHSLTYASTRELDEISRSLETTGREYYQQARQELAAAVERGEVKPVRMLPENRAKWPPAVAEFSDSGEDTRFNLAGEEGDRLDYLVRRGAAVDVYSKDLGAVAMDRLSEQYARARSLIETAKARDLRRGFTYTYVLLMSAIWMVSLLVLVYLASRISRPIGELTNSLLKLSAGDLSVRLHTDRRDEVGKAIRAFNHMAGQLHHSRERLVFLTRLAGWQQLARKMAHEVKNSLTPIRLTIEEISARGADGDRAFLEQAAQIVVDEVNSLERRVRAFSEFAAEPPVRPAILNVNALLEERVAFLRTAHPEVAYQLRLVEDAPQAFADEDLVKGILTNLLENAAEAAGAGGAVLAATRVERDTGQEMIALEVHDSGPGLSMQAIETLFEPAISFKKGGMGLGLSIARRSALLCGGDIVLIQGELGGAAFRLLLPARESPMPDDINDPSCPQHELSSSTTKKISAAR
ncbi:MAG TPA: ATP-binding protein [Bryobacteraceae bacterium]|nr:ATP-binding protein [Bryobacteraceae bacterium]